MVQALESPQLEPGVSKLQSAAQQSPATVPPSSQSSPGSRTPFPQLATREATPSPTSERGKESPLSGFVTVTPLDL